MSPFRVAHDDRSRYDGSVPPTRRDHRRNRRACKRARVARTLVLVGPWRGCPLLRPRLNGAPRATVQPSAWPAAHRPPRPRVVPRRHLDDARRPSGSRRLLEAGERCSRIQNGSYGKPARSCQRPSGPRGGAPGGGPACLRPPTAQRRRRRWRRRRSCPLAVVVDTAPCRAVGVQRQSPIRRRPKPGPQMRASHSRDPCGWRRTPVIVTSPSSSRCPSSNPRAISASTPSSASRRTTSGAWTRTLT